MSEYIESGGVLSRKRVHHFAVSATAVLLAAYAPSWLVAHASGAQFSTWYVSAKKGSDRNPGTREKPWQTIEKAASSIHPGDTVLIEPGVYRAWYFHFRPAGLGLERRTTFRFARPNNRHGRAVLTCPNGVTPSFDMAPFTRIEGLWIGGSPPASQKGGAIGAINREGIEVIRCTFWGRYFQLITGKTARNILVRDNLLMHMGGDWLHHPIYISGGPAPTTQDCRFIGNVILNGGGFALHCYHKPINVTIVGNFTSGCMADMVAQGPGHIIHHNVFWKPRGRPDRPYWNWNALLPNDVVRFDHNLLGSNHPIREGGKPKFPPVENYSLAGIRGTQVNLIPLPKRYRTRLPLVHRSERRVDYAIRKLDAYFKKNTPEEMASDTTTRVQSWLAILRVKYEPTPEDLASRPVK